MRAWRTCGLIGAFAGIALALVALRVEQTRSAAAALEMEAKWVQLRRERWRLQTHIARLRTPTQIRDRVDWFKVALVPPGSTDGSP